MRIRTKLLMLLGIVLLGIGIIGGNIPAIVRGMPVPECGSVWTRGPIVDVCSNALALPTVFSMSFAVGGIGLLLVGLAMGMKQKWDKRKRTLDESLKVAEISIIALGIIAAGTVGVYQLMKVDESLTSSTAASIYAQQQEINHLFVEHEELQPYFWHNHQAPERDVSVAAAVASRLLDHFEHLMFQLDSNAFDEERDGWEAYMRGSFADSPVLCRTLVKDIEEYGGIGIGTMWDKYAKEPCSAD